MRSHCARALIMTSVATRVKCYAPSEKYLGPNQTPPISKKKKNDLKEDGTLLLLSNHFS